MFFFVLGYMYYIYTMSIINKYSANSAMEWEDSVK